MAVTLTSLLDPPAPGFDAVIDVRSPGEYADDHLPGAINLPVMDDAERARVGTIYKQVSPFDARKVGAAIVARNAARHIEGALAPHGGGWRPLLYCWRGGMRSNALAIILRQIGWRAEVVEGGYKSWRRLVVDRLEAPFPAPVVVLDGNTGTAKTELLPLLAERGVQVIDLEGLARHRGSLFGSMGDQPPQRLFEGRLAMAMARLDPARPVAIEAESARVGDCRLPPTLWKAMRAAPRIALEAPLEQRAAYLTRTYADLAADPARLAATLAALRPWHPADRIAGWQALATAGRFTPLAAELATHHYDPRYRKHRARVSVPVTGLPVHSLAPADLPGLADRLAALIATLPACPEDRP